MKNILCFSHSKIGIAKFHCNLDVFSWMHVLLYVIGIAHVAVVNPVIQNVVVKPVTQIEDLDLDSDIDSVIYSSGSECK